MRAKRHLEKIRKLDIQVGQRITELNQMRERLSIITGIDYSKDRIQTMPSTGNKQIETIVDMEIEILELIQKETELKNRIIGEIQILDNPIYVDLLFRRYVQCESFEKIAYDMGYAYNYVLNLHGRALEEFDDKVLIKC